MESHINCPGNSATIRNAVFGLKAKGVPDEVANQIRECDTCFVSFYGDHLVEDLLKKTLVSTLGFEEKIHFDNCLKCRTMYRKLHPIPNKMGKSHLRYIEAIS